MTERHTHHWACGETDEEDTLVFKMESLIAEDLLEVHATALAPVLVVVAFEDIPWLVEPVQLLLSNAKRCSVSGISNVSRDEYKVDAVVVVNLIHR